MQALRVAFGIAFVCAVAGCERNDLSASDRAQAEHQTRIDEKTAVESGHAGPRADATSSSPEVVVKPVPAS